MSTDIFEDRKVQKNLQLPKGYIILNSSEKLCKLNYIVNGEVEYIYNDEHNKKHVLSLGSNNFIYPANILNCEPVSFTIITSSNVIINSYPILNISPGFFKKSIPTAKLFISSLINEFNRGFQGFKKFLNFYMEVLKLYDNMLLYLSLGGKQLYLMDSEGSSQKIINDAQILKEKFIKNSGFFPKDKNTRFFEVDNSEYIEKSYEINLQKFGVRVDLVNIILQYVKLDPKLKEIYLTKSPGFIFYIFKSLSFETKNLFSQILSLYPEIDKLLIDLFSSKNNLSKSIYKAIELESKNRALEFKNYIEDKFKKFSENYKSIFKVISHSFNLNIEDKDTIVTSSEEPEVKKEPKKKKKDIELSEILAEAEAEDDVDFDIDSIFEKKQESKKKISMSKIFVELINYGNFDKSNAKVFAKAVDQLINSKDLYSDNDRIKKAKRAIRVYFWDLYKKIILNYFKGKRFTNYIKLFLNYSILDERLVKDEHFSFLIGYEDLTFSKYSIYNPIEWLSQIYEEKIEPSINDLGQTFDDILKEEARRITKKSKNQELPIPERKLNFEIDNLFTKGSRVLTDSPLSSIPVFISMMVSSDLEKYILTKEKIEKEVENILNLDYSLFYREALYRTESHVEIYYKKVEPIFIKLPIIGTKVFLWQDHGSHKLSPLRIIFPMFFKGDLRKSLIYAFGNYRWEICKTFKGPRWSDPVYGGLTGKYFDYINFYQKNPNLSLDVKKALKEKFAGLKTDREKFVNDYYTWLEFESKGIIKLNGVVREILMFEVPFPKEVIERLKNIPVFQKLAIRFYNIRRKELNQTIKKYRKYEDEEGNLPPELLESLQLLKK